MEGTRLYNMDMKKIFATAALICSLAANGTEEAMNQALNTWQQQVADYEAALKAAPTDEARAHISAPNGRDVAPMLWQAINGRTGTRKNEKGKGNIPTFEFEKPWALPAIIWILEHPQAFTAAFSEDEQQQLTYFGNALVESLIRVHFSHPRIGEACPSLSATSSVREYELLQKIYQRNRHKEARACAALGMSLMLNNSMVCSVEGSDAMARAKRLYYLKQAILLSGKDTRFGAMPITEVAMEQAYYLRHLAVGCVAPQIQVSNQQNETLQLPITNKLNLLIFWSPSEQAGTSMVRDIDKIKSQYPELEVFPIMPYTGQEEQQTILNELGIANTLTDNANGAAGTTYRIDQLPTVILISKQSTILYGGAPDMKLQHALETATADERAAAKAARPTVIIKETEPAPVKPAAPTPAPQNTDQVPGLREMPEF